MKSIFSLVCSVLVIVSLSLQWWVLDLETTATWRNQTVDIYISDITGWELFGETGLIWVGSTGPILAFIGGILVLVCVVMALITTKWFPMAKNVFAILRIAPRIAGFLTVMGAVWYMIDARNAAIEGCGGVLPFDGIGPGTWVATAAGLGVLLTGVSVPSVTQMWRREFGEEVAKSSPVKPGMRDFGFQEDRSAGPSRTYSSAKDHYNRASDLQSTGKDTQAVVEYDTAIRLDPNYTLAYFNRGSLLLSQGRKLDAKVDFEKVIELADDPDLVRMARQRIKDVDSTDDEKKADAVMPEGQTEGADKKPAVEPDSMAKNHFDRACDYEARGDDERAILAYTQAIDSDSKYTLAYFNRGSLRLLNGDAREAIADFEKVIKLSTDDNMIDTARKRIDEARAIFEPPTPAPIEEKQSDEIIDVSAVTDLGIVETNHFDRAREYEASGDDEKAIEAYSQVIADEPTNAVAYFNRGSLYLLRDARIEAIADFKKVIKISDDDTMIEMAQDRISELTEQEFD